MESEVEFFGLYAFEKPSRPRVSATFDSEISPYCFLKLECNASFASSGTIVFRHIMLTSKKCDGQGKHFYVHFCSHCIMASLLKFGLACDIQWR